MIITDDFVALNLPKTGSTYLRSAVRRAHRERLGLLRYVAFKLGLITKPDFRELLLPHIDDTSNPELRDQHGTYRQIPVEHRDKKILTVVRNPLDRLVSVYRFAWWKTHPPGDETAIREAYPNFPDLSFAEFVDLFNTFAVADRLKGLQTKMEIGIQTIQFVQFYFPEPERVLRQMDDEWIASGSYRELLPDVTFLHQENLNRELYEFLKANGYDEVDLSFVLDGERVNITPGQEATVPHLDYYKDGLLEQTIERERLLFHLFPGYAPERVSAGDR